MARGMRPAAERVGRKEGKKKRKRRGDGRKKGERREKGERVSRGKQKERKRERSQLTSFSVASVIWQPFAENRVGFARRRLTVRK
jgi:hypothetical protein